MQRCRRSLRGIIVVSTLLISTILLLLVSGLLVSINNEEHLSLRNAHATEALFLGEAGIADATYQLSASNAWEPVGTERIQVDFPEVNGRYTIEFYDGVGQVERHESVNNLDTDSSVDGPRGPATVPPKTADIVVKVELKGREFYYEALISRGFSEPVSVPLLTSGKIRMEGDVLIQGVESLGNPIPIEAGIHSNMRASTPGIIEWRGGADDKAYISGIVSTTSGHPDAIRAPGSGEFNVGSVEVGQASQQFPVVDIDLAVRSGRGATPLVPNPGATTTLRGRDFRFEGGVINGDLVLDGVNLFVDGPLEVNGTITGSGAIYVRGDTSLRGSAELISDERTLALFSKGNVKLEGFDGSQYLEERAEESEDFFTWNEDAKWAHEELMARITQEGSYGGDAENPSTWGNTPGGEVDQLRAVLGSETQVVPDERSQDSLGKMADYLEMNYAGNETADFLVQRLKDTRNLYRDGGSIDVANDTFNPSLAAGATRRAGRQNFDKLGVSFIQGLIYTNGAVYATNEVQVVGALMAEKNGDSPEREWEVGGERLQAGDVYLTGGSSLIYNKELVENPFASAPNGPVVVCSWLGR